MKNTLGYYDRANPGPAVANPGLPRRLVKPGVIWSSVVCLLLLSGCTHTVKVEPIKVEPIDITLHIYLQADEKLDSFFDFQDAEPAASGASGSATTSEGAPS